MRQRAIAALAVGCLAAGLALSQLVEPGVSVKSVTLAGDTPALQFLPAGSGPHPVALLAHGITASKESLFRCGEAFAAAGFVCFSIDFPGHGGSPRSFSPRDAVRALEQVAQGLGSVDVFLGHSMGANVGAEAVRQRLLTPWLFIAMGANPDLGEHGPPLLLLAGQFEEFVPPSVLRRRTGATFVISPWCDHALEPFDPLLVNPGVAAACSALGKPPPAPPTRWCWRLTGLVLGTAGALALGLCRPQVFPGLRAKPGVAGLMLAVILILSLAVTAQKWVGAMPHLRRVPVQLATAVLAWLILSVAGKLRIPRWAFLAIPPVVAVAAVLLGANLLALRSCLFGVLLAEATLLGVLAAWRGSRRDGDLAMATLLGYAFGQWLIIL